MDSPVPRLAAVVLIVLGLAGLLRAATPDSAPAAPAAPKAPAGQPRTSVGPHSASLDGTTGLLVAGGAAAVSVMCLLMLATPGGSGTHRRPDDTPTVEGA